MKPPKPLSDDFLVLPNGNIRHIAGETIYSVSDFSAWLMEYAPEAIVKRTDCLFELLPPFNIDDKAATYLCEGAIVQHGDIVYASQVSIDTVLQYAQTLTSAVVPPKEPQVIYVDGRYLYGPERGTISEPFRTINSAILYAEQNHLGDPVEIRIAPGVYPENINVPSTVSLTFKECHNG